MTTKLKLQYNLITEPWIPVSNLSGQLESVGLKELFPRAHEFRDLAESSPLVRVAIYRLLLAILYRTQQVEEDEDWVQLWENGWDSTAIQDYLERWHDRFYLCSERYPLYQRIELSLDEKSNPITKLSNEFAAGNNKQLFDHSVDDAPIGVDFSRAAKLLIEAQSWSIGGGKSGFKRPNFTSCPLPKGASVIPTGKNLFETLMFSLIPKSEFMAEPYFLIRKKEEDLPAWERAGEPMVDERTCNGPADYLTWQHRYIRLKPEEDGTVRFALYAQGEKLISPAGADAPLIDPFHSFRDDGPKGFIPKGIQPEKSVWRDSESLFFQREKNATSLSLFQLNSYRNKVTRPIPSTIDVLVTGIAVPGGQPPPDLWCSDSFQLPLELVESNAAQISLSNALELAKEGASAVRKSVYAYGNSFLEMSTGSADPDVVGKLTSALSREAQYWATLALPFQDFLPNVAEANTDAKERWKQAVIEAATEAFEHSLQSQEGTGRHFKAANAARGAFQFHLSKLNQTNSTLGSTTK